MILRASATYNTAALPNGKGKYRARADVNSCGHWLAVALKDTFRPKDGGLELTAFKACLKETDIDRSKVDIERHGAIGRFRICAGLMLGRHAREAGFVIIDGKKIQAPGTKKPRGRKAKTAEAES